MHQQTHPEPRRTCFLLRYMIRRDLPEVLGIEEDAFWPDQADEAGFLEFLRHQRPVAMVAEEGELIAGFALYTVHRNSIALRRIAVARGFRRRGVGRQMIDQLRARLRARGRRTLIVDVPEELDGAHRWLKACGLRAVRVLRREVAAGGDLYRFVCGPAEDG
jgi:ribosomal-protein-alanine N-acetyltransferase